MLFPSFSFSCSSSSFFVWQRLACRLTIFEWSVQRKDTIQFQCWQFNFFCCQRHNHKESAGTPPHCWQRRVWPSALQLRLLLAFCWQQDNGRAHAGVSGAHKIKQTMTRQEPKWASLRKKTTAEPALGTKYNMKLTPKSDSSKGRGRTVGAGGWWSGGAVTGVSAAALAEV